MAGRTMAPSVSARGGVGLVRFAQECWAELQKVTWPDRQTIARLTVLVLLISAIVGMYILGADQVFTFVINDILLNPATPAPEPVTP